MHYVFCTFFGFASNKVGHSSPEVLLFTDINTWKPPHMSPVRHSDFTASTWPAGLSSDCQNNLSFPQSKPKAPEQLAHIKTLKEKLIKLKTRQVITQTRRVWRWTRKSGKSVRKYAAVRVSRDLRCSLFRVVMDWCLSLRVCLNVGHKDQFYRYWHLHSWVMINNPLQDKTETTIIQYNSSLTARTES